MGITRRILESAQSGLSKLTSLVIVDDEPLSHVESTALQAELAARRAAKEKLPSPPHDNPLAKQAVAHPMARQARENAAKSRAVKVHGERDAAAARAKAAADEAFRRMKDQASSSPRSGPAASSSSNPGPRRPPKPGSSHAQVLEWYRVLDISIDADLPQIKTAYRQMMRKYHPDMHAGNPTKQKAANELSLRVTTAYEGLVAHLDKK